MNKLFRKLGAKFILTLPLSLSRKIAKNEIVGGLVTAHVPQLLVDVSVIASEDARTGIQRVVRAVFIQMMVYPAGCYEICPVFATRDEGYNYAQNFLQEFTPPGSGGKAGPVVVKPGDIFLGLDLSAHIFPRHLMDLLQWKRQGVKFVFVVYDLLPILKPEWFNRRTNRNFVSWISSIIFFADSLICISNSLRFELSNWLNNKLPSAENEITFGVMPLGADIDASGPSKGMPPGAKQFLDCLRTRNSVLMVGTLEPRKGHEDILSAFELLWGKNEQVSLVFVGRAGWKTDALQKKIISHPLYEDKLFWLDDVSDEYLSQLYICSTGVIIGSKGEGFGLPLIEALNYKKPVLARDIPVFREIAGEAVTFFEVFDTHSVAESISNWLKSIHCEEQKNCDLALPTWKDAASYLLRHCQYSI